MGKAPVQSKVALADATERGIRRVILTVALVLMQLLFSVCSDRQQVAFVDLKAARAGGAVARGWIPNDLPGSSTELQELHDVDSNEV